MAKKYQTSASCHSAYVSSRGLASTTSGTSQITYWGDQTLLASRNAASTRKNTCGTRGRRGAARTRTQISAHATPNSAADTRLSEPWPSEPASGQCSVSKKYQIDPQSAGRVALTW